MQKNSVVVLCGIFFLFMTTFPAMAAESVQSNLYRVKSGDSLPTIAKNYETTVEEIKLTNGLQTEALLVDQMLRVPIQYEVVPGDTFQELASRFHSTLELIKGANSLTTNELMAGQVINVPPKRLRMDGQHILMTKEEFADWLFNHQFKRKISLVQEHHTFLPSYKHFHGNNHFQMLKSMEHYHKSQKKWSNIAQNLTTFPDGTVAVSDPLILLPKDQSVLTRTQLELQSKM